MLPISMPGMSRDHTDAATMTPEAKPKSIFCIRTGISFFMKKTNADPIAVPARGMSRPVKIASISYKFTKKKQ